MNQKVVQKAEWVAWGSRVVVGLGIGIGLWCATAYGGSATLAWNASPGQGLRYRLYCGGVSHVYTNCVEAGTNLTATVNNLQNGTTYYFSATCYAQDGTESDYSNEISYRLAPQPPALRQDQVLVEVPVTFWSSTNLHLTNWQVLGGSSAWLLVPATNQAEFFSATSSVVPGTMLGLTITPSTNQ